MSRFESISTMKQKSWLSGALGLSVLSIGTALVLLPLLIVVMTSLLPSGSATGAFWSEKGWSGDNYRQAWLGGRFLLAFANSTFVALSVTGLQVITSALAGYALARLQFWGRQTVLLIALATLVIPFQLLVIPVFLVLKSAHLLNTYGALILLLDGATRWQMLWQVLLPLTRPAVVTLFLFTFIGEWNDLFKPLVFTTKPELITVQLTLANFQEQFTNNWPLMMAAVVISSLPIVLLCILGQRQLVRGIATTGVKG
jgi:multiple sugar transport system permease protein